MNTVIGKVKYHPKQGLKVYVSFDFCLFYRWLISKDNWNTLVPEVPRFGAHINIWNPNVHNKAPKNPRKWHNKEIEINYDPEKLIKRKSRKGFFIWWFDVESKELCQILEETGMKSEFDSRNRPHLTIGNTKYLL